jgi:MFS superfamily sulfate permease-like transporter
MTVVLFTLAGGILVGIACSFLYLLGRGAQAAWAWGKRKAQP